METLEKRFKEKNGMQESVNLPGQAIIESSLYLSFQR